jgi:hypothetical protein
MLIFCPCIPAQAKHQPSQALKPAPAPALAALKDPATPEQIREYLKLSGEMDSYRARWIASVDANRSIGAPYWPASFWSTVKAEMRRTDLEPTYIQLYQHAVSRELMAQVLSAYHTLGAQHFSGSPQSAKLNAAWAPMQSEMEQVKLAKTREVIYKVFNEYKPQIKAAQAKYLAQHPESKEK